MSLMMDDNLAGSGNTITEVASVSCSFFPLPDVVRCMLILTPLYFLPFVKMKTTG